MDENAVGALTTVLVILGCAAILTSLVLGAVLAPRGASLWKKLLWIRDWSTGLPWLRLRVGLLGAGLALLGLSHTVEVSGGNPARYARYALDEIQRIDGVLVAILAAVAGFPIIMVHWGLASEKLEAAPRHARPGVITRAVLTILWQVPAMVVLVIAAAIFLG